MKKWNYKSPMSIKSRVELSIIWPVIASGAADYLRIANREGSNASRDDISNHFDGINCEGRESVPVRRWNILWGHKGVQGKGTRRVERGTNELRKHFVTTFPMHLQFLAGGWWSILRASAWMPSPSLSTVVWSWIWHWSWIRVVWNMRLVKPQNLQLL